MVGFLSFICINRSFGVVSVISYLRDCFCIKKQEHNGGSGGNSQEPGDQGDSPVMTYMFRASDGTK